MNKFEKTILCHERLARCLGSPFDRRTPILDFGCGAGALVLAYREQGYQAYGYDLEDFSPGQQNSALDYFRFRNKGCDARSMRVEGTFRLPFDSASFGFVFSEATLEHVMDYDSALGEISRVQRDGTFSLHLFPPRYVPIEPHINVPFASFFPSYGWLLLWARLGVMRRAADQSAAEAASAQVKYLRDCTNYLSKAEIRGAAATHFGQVGFIDDLYYACWPGRLRVLGPLFTAIPSLKHLHSALRMRILLLGK